jgi:hypothetical protein
MTQVMTNLFMKDGLGSNDPPGLNTWEVLAQWYYERDSGHR